MSKAGVCNQFRLDTGRCMEQIKNHQLRAFAEAEDQFLSIMEREVQKTTHGDAPGKPEWRTSLRDRLGVIRETVTSDFIEAEIGVDTNMLFTDFVKAMVIAYGSGSAAGNERIHKGPPGRMVWDDNLDGKHPSTAAYTTDYMPDEFNQTGNKFVDNAVDLMKRHYDNVLKDALASLPDSVFYGNVIVS